MRIITIVGARPQFIKAAVLSRYLQENKSTGINETIIHTGQHYDKNMSDVFFEEMNIPRPAININVKSRFHGEMTGRMLIEIEKLLIDMKPNAVLVYGDTNSTLAGTLAASKLHIPVAHVEAGLRSFMMEMPEEQNRRLTDHLSTWLMCPTQTAINNLQKEGIVHTKLNKYSFDNKCVSLTGDIMYDASLYYRRICEEKLPNVIDGRDYILLTIHRAENTDNLENLVSIVDAINNASHIKFIFPIHPRTRKIINDKNLKFHDHVQLIEPQGYLNMLKLEMNCKAVMTDSGGVQKEAYFFKKPCITLRDSTEWVELVDSGWNILTGANRDLIDNALQNFSIPGIYNELYGDGNCAEKIVNTLLEG